MEKEGILALAGVKLNVNFYEQRARNSRSILLMLRMTVYLLSMLPALGEVPAGPYTVKGIVQNTVTAEPIRNALITLQGATTEPNKPPQQVFRVAFSGPSGEFQFDGLPAGSYSCSPSKPGFASEDGHPAGPVDFEIPQSASVAIHLPLTPQGVIQGTVINQFEEPVEYVFLVIYCINTWNGEQLTSEIGRPRTDHRGRFQLTRVPPGRYYVKVAGRDGGTELHTGPEKRSYGPWESFAPAYFGGAQDRTSAAPIEIKAGTISEVNFRVNLQRAFKVHGAISSYTPGNPVEFQLLQGNEPGLPQRVLLETTSGKFQILDVLPGSYTLRATQGMARGEVAINIGEGDLDGIPVALLPAVTLHGVTHVANGSAQEPGIVSNCSTNLHDPRREADYPAESRVAGEYSIPNVFPGEYRVDLLCSGAYPVSASFGGVDLMANPAITVSSTEARAMNITLHRGGGTLNVTLAGEAKKADALLLVPQFRSLVGPFLRDGQPNMFQTGASFRWLAPGEYLLYALPSFEGAAYRNPAFLQSLSGAAAVRIEEDKVTGVTLERISR